MRAAWLEFERGGMAWLEEDGGRILAWRVDGTWIRNVASGDGTFPDEWQGGEIPGTAPVDKYVPQRGLGHCWDVFGLVSELGYAVQPAEQGIDGDYEMVEGGCILRLGAEVRHLVEKLSEVEPPLPPPGPAPGLDVVWLPVLDMPINLLAIGFVNQQGRAQFTFYDFALALPDEDGEFLRERLEARVKDADRKEVDSDVGAEGRGKRARRR